MSELTQAKKLPIDGHQGSSIGSHQLLPLFTARLKCLGPFRRFPPYDLSIRSIHTGKRRIGFVTTIETVKVAVLVNRGVEVQRELLSGPHHPMCEIREYFE